MEEQPSRRREYTEATRAALVDSATRLFAHQGYVGTSLAQVAAEARLTKGAVYHHFSGKEALFEAVLDQLEESSAATILAASADRGTTWEGAMAALEAFLDLCLDPTYQRLCFQEGPIALGFQGWWEAGERHEIGLIKAMLTALHHEGLVEVGDLDALTQVVYGSLTASALYLARSGDQAAVRDRLSSVVRRLFEGLRPAGTPALGTP